MCILFHFLISSTSVKVKIKVTQLPLTLDSVDCIVHGILQARILACIAFPFSRGCSQHRDWIQVSHIAGRFPAEPQGSPRILEWVASHFSSGSSWPRNWTGVSFIAGGFCTNWAIRKVISILCHTHPWMTCSLDISSFLEVFLSLFHSVVVLYFFAWYI